MFSKDGVSPDPCKVKAIKSTGRPRNATEHNSFLCTVRYSTRFMEASRYQKAACKLGKLVTRKFEWKQEHSEAFEELKNMLSSDTVQAYFDPQAEHELHIDGCPVGLAETLTQRKPGEQCWRVVQYASLTDPDKRYSQIELEALAGDFGCKKFHLFLYGRPFKIVTDHKPLESVFNKPTHTTSIRVQRIVNRMMDYRLSQSRSLLIEWTWHERLLSLAARQIYRRNFPPVALSNQEQRYESTRQSN